MKKKRVLFIGSLPTKKYFFDGERNKTRDVLNSIRKKYGNKISIINLSLNQYFQVVKMIVLAKLKKFDFIFVSKCLVGGSRAVKYLNKFSNKHNKNRIIYYLIGNGSNGFDEKTIYFDCLNTVHHIIVESPDVQKEIISKNIAKNERISIIPCLKPDYDIKPIQKEYPVSTLRLIYFSRITELKGIMDIIFVISKINNEQNKMLFSLDIAGGSAYDVKEQQFLDKVKLAADKENYFKYLGLNLRINGIESYKRLQMYDLHVFPSKFFQECAPGSIVDMFIAGVPTLTSSFPSAKYIMNSNDSFFFEMNNNEDLENKLLMIYNNQNLLNQMRINCHKNASLYSETRFLNELDKILEALE